MLRSIFRSLFLASIPPLLLACTSDQSPYNFDRTNSKNWDQTVRTKLNASGESGNGVPPPTGAGSNGENKKETDEREITSGTVRVNQLVNRAVRRNRDVRSAEERWKSATHRARSVSGLPDPELMTMVAVEPVQTRDGPIDWQARLSQKFPWFGKLDAKEKRQLARAGEQYKQYQETKISVVKDVKTAYAEYRYLHGAIDITRNMIDYLERMEAAVRETYESGEAPVHDVLRLENEREELDTERRDRQDRLRAARAKLNSLLDRPPDAELAEPAGNSQEFPEFNEGQLTEVLMEHRPRIEKARYRRLAAGQRARAARLDYYPDFRAGVMYSGVGDSDKMGTVDAGSDAYGVQLTLNLPLWRSKRNAELRSARFEQRSARMQMEEEINRAEAELSGALAEFRDAGRRIDLYSGTVVPNAERSRTSAREEYTAGEMDIVSFLDFQNRLLRARLNLLRARADRRKSAAELEWIVGVSLSDVKENQ